jgi:hypothetical protein
MDDAEPRDVLFKIESYWAEWPPGGYMPLEKALEFVESVMAAFRATRAITPDFPAPQQTT